jgi:dihydroorotate dehydrogenase
MGLSFRNPVGLGAGFDKNASYLSELDQLGFGFVEIGTVTPLPQSGNEKPRLFRLPKDKALINRMGFNNDGVDAMVHRLSDWRKKYPDSSMIIGGNIGKNKITTNEDAWIDYRICFEKLFDHVDYFVVNVSSPNTPGLRALQEKGSLIKIFDGLQKINLQKQYPKPILLKIAPDLMETEIDEILSMYDEKWYDGLIVANTTITRENLKTDQSTIQHIGSGGLSGFPLKEKSNALLQYIYNKSNGSIPVIGSGGIMHAEDAKEKINCGAGLVQVWTGFIYQGPSIIKKICKTL